MEYGRGYNFLEVFSGAGRVSQKMYPGISVRLNFFPAKSWVGPIKMAFVDPFLCLRHSLGYSVASIDYDYGAREMDFCP